MTMRNIITITILGLALTVTACDKGDAAKKADNKTATAKQPDKAVTNGNAGNDADQPDAPDLDPKVEKAVTVANQISASPSDADSILSDAGLDRESFDKLLYEIARDPELSKSYAIARET